MPWDRSRYPDDWDALRATVLERAGNRCEWCGAANHSEVESAAGRMMRVVLTIAHIDCTLPDGTIVSKHDKDHHHLEALRALCQSCHLRYDHADHVRHAAETRRRKQIEAGQRILLEAGA